MNHPAPDRPELETALGDVSEFVTAARAEIIAILDRVIARRTLVTVYFSEPRQHIVTTLLGVNPDFEELIFEGAQNQHTNQLLMLSRQTDFVTYADEIKIQFSASGPEPAVYRGQPALRMRIPQSLLRFQRRNYYRVPAPRSGPLTCEVALPGGLPVNFSVTDLSVGGIGVLTGPVPPAFQPGAVFPTCRVELPGHGGFTTALEVRHTKTGKLATLGQWRHEYGCQFRNLGGPVVSLIQRYINQIERSRRALL